MDPIMVYEQATELITREIKKLVDKGNIDKETLCLIGEAIDVQKDLETLKAMQNYEDNDSNQRYERSNRSYTNRYNNSWDNDMMNNSNRYSYNNNNGISGHNNTEQLIYKLEDAMNMATDRQSRETIRMALEKLEKM